MLSMVESGIASFLISLLFMPCSDYYRSYVLVIDLLRMGMGAHPSGPPHETEVPSTSSARFDIPQVACPPLT